MEPEAFPPPVMVALQRTARDVRMRLLVRVTVLHSIGALMVFAYLQQVHPASQVFDIAWLNDYALLIISGGALVPVAWVWAHAQFRRRSRWALDGRVPTDGDRRRLLAEPWRMAARPMALWVVAAGLISGGIVVRGQYSAAHLIDVAQIVVIGGFAISAFSYIIIEQTYRPLFAYALGGRAASRPASLGIRPRLLLVWIVSSGVPLLGLALSPLRESGTSLVAVAVLATIGLLGGLFGNLVAANTIAEPLDDLRHAMGRVAGGDLLTELPVDDGGEVGQVQAGFNRMVSGLRERAEIADLFSRHVGTEVAEHALETGTGLGGEARRASVIFVDLIGSTAMAEVLPPGEVVATLNAFFQAVVDTVQAEGGWVNKFEGDGALCVFGVPGFQADHEARALRAARLLRDRLAEVAESHPGLDAGIGVSSGTVVAGNVGTEQRYEFTVIGRAVNEAARLTDLAKQRPGRVLASSGAVRSAGPERAHWVDRGRVGLRGQQAPTVIFEPNPVAGDVVTDQSTGRPVTTNG